MTITDAATQLATAYAPTAVATNVNGTYVDVVTSNDLGKGADILWYTQVVAAATTSAGATVQFKLQGNPSDPTFASGTVDIELAPLTAIAAASLTAGTEYKVKIRRGSPYRYYRIAVVIGTGVLTAGTFNSWLTIDDMQDNVSYPAGYTISAG
jgi:hypothetical protein